MKLINRIAAAAAITALACTSITAFADGPRLHRGPHRQRSENSPRRWPGKVAESNKVQVERATIRRVLGSSTMQVLDLK
jgi:hypothetical protein